MKREDLQAIVAKIVELWPKTDWPPDVKAETMRRINAMPIGFDQARAALVNLRIAKSFAKIDPGEVLEALEAITPKARHDGTGGGHDAQSVQDRQVIDVALQTDPRRFYGLVAVLFIVEPDLPLSFAQTVSACASQPRARRWLADAIQGRIDLSPFADRMAAFDRAMEQEDAAADLHGVARLERALRRVIGSIL